MVELVFHLSVNRLGHCVGTRENKLAIKETQAK